MIYVSRVITVRWVTAKVLKKATLILPCVLGGLGGGDLPPIIIYSKRISRGAKEKPTIFLWALLNSSKPCFKSSLASKRWKIENQTTAKVTTGCIKSDLWNMVPEHSRSTYLWSLMEHEGGVLMCQSQSYIHVGASPHAAVCDFWKEKRISVVSLSSSLEISVCLQCSKDLILV